MNYFATYHSNTLAAGANQLFFRPEDPNHVYKGRVFYKIFASGQFTYSFLFSTRIDSTFADGSLCHKNVPCKDWALVGLRVGVCATCNETDMVEVGSMQTVDLSQNTPVDEDLFCTGGIPITAQKDQYICLEIEFKGKTIPYHE